MFENVDLSGLDKLLEDYVDSLEEMRNLTWTVLVCRYKEYNLEDSLEYSYGIIKDKSKDKFIEMYEEYDYIGYQNFVLKYGDGRRWV